MSLVFQLFVVYKDGSKSVIRIMDGKINSNNEQTENNRLFMSMFVACHENVWN